MQMLKGIENQSMIYKVATSDIYEYISFGQGYKKTILHFEEIIFEIKMYHFELNIAIIY